MCVVVCDVLTLTGTSSGTLPRLRPGRGLSKLPRAIVWICLDKQAEISNPRVWWQNRRCPFGEKGVLIRMILPVNQLSINGAVADLRAEDSMVIPTEVPIAHSKDQTDVRAQGNLLAEYELKHAALPEQEKLTKLCSNAGFSN